MRSEGEGEDVNGSDGSIAGEALRCAFFVNPFVGVDAPTIIDTTDDLEGRCLAPTIVVLVVRPSNV